MDGKDQAAALYGGETANETIDAEEARTLSGNDLSEEELHKGCVQWARAQSGALPELDALLHVPNGGKMPRGSAGKLKGMGMRKGVPDLLLPVPRPVTWTNGDRQAAGALWIELKSQSGRLRDSQKEWRARLMKHGHAWTLVRTLDAFRAAVTDYLAGDYRQAPIDDM
jgi:hypothetical protein